MDFGEFILAHDGDDLARLALDRDKYISEVEDFELALTTLEVRRKLRLKVPQWYALPGLRYPLRLSGEQCSSSAAAFYKASVVPARSVADLTGGLGVDSWAFSQVASQVLYNEMQPILADAARHNFGLLGVKNVTVRNCRLDAGGLTEVLDGFEPDLIFLDPARRAEDGRKVFRLEDCSPNVLKLLPELFEAAPRIMLKLSPMADITLVCKQLGHVKEVHVVAADGECKELLLLLERGYEGAYSITIFENGFAMPLDQVQGVFGRGPFLGAGPGPGCVPQSSLSGIIVGPGPRDEIGPGPNIGWTRSMGPTVGDKSAGDDGLAILFEPGKALLKAGAFDLPLSYGLEKIGRHTHLYIGPVPEELKPFGKVYQIQETVPLNSRSIKDIAKRYPRADVTARNIPLTSDQLRKKLGVKDGGPVHIFGVHSDAHNANLLLICVV